MLKKRLIDTSHELKIYRYAEGFRLVRPNEKMASKNNMPTGIFTGHTISSAFQFQLCITVLDTNCMIQTINELSAATGGHGSIRSALGKTIANVATPETSCHILNHNQEVMALKKMRFYDEEAVLRKNGNLVNYFSIKSPLFNDEGQVIGLLGCGFNSIMSSYENSFIQLKQLGLINSPKLFFLMNFHLNQNRINNYHLSKREVEVIHHTISGKTAKQIAKILNLSPRTIEHYLENIKIKMNIATKNDLLEKFYASSQNLFSTQDRAR